MSDRAWQQFANEINGRFEKTGFIFKKARVQGRVESWMIAGGDFSERGEAGGDWSELRIPYSRRVDFRFGVSKRGWTPVPFGGQDIATGDDEFDRRFEVKGKDEALVLELLEDDSLRGLIATRLSGSIETKISRGGWSALAWRGLRGPSIRQLEAARDVMAATMAGLVRISAASEEPPR